jgi:hypothetical protein
MELEQTGFINGNRNLLYPKIPFFLSSRAYRDPTVPITQYNGLCHVTQIGVRDHGFVYQIATRNHGFSATH